MSNSSGALEPVKTDVPLSERDFYPWAQERAGLLRAGRVAEADIARIALELESAGHRKKRALVALLTVLLMDPLKWQFQPALRG